MSEVKSEREDRIKKLDELKKLNINPFPAKVNRTHTIRNILKSFVDFEKTKEDVTIAGRLRSNRAHGNLSFAQIDDGSGKIQIAISKKEVGVEQYKQFIKLIDTADFIEVKGECFVTHKGENSILVKKLQILTKAIRPLPDKFHGLVDEEERYRKRYLDILINPEVREIIEKKAKFWNSVRNFLTNKGFLEVETPVLETTTGGADARPFITHHNALDIDVYLRISAGELWQKKLMVAGFEKTFEIARIFRNEGMSAEHLQDYTQMEFSWAYADYKMGMELTEELYNYIAKETFGTLKFKIGKHNVDLSKKWETYDYISTIKKFTKVDVSTASLVDIESKLKELRVGMIKKALI